MNFENSDIPCSSTQGMPHITRLPYYNYPMLNFFNKHSRELRRDDFVQRAISSYILCIYIHKGVLR